MTFEQLDKLIQDYPQIMKITVSRKDIEDLITCTVNGHKPEDVTTVFYKDLQIERLKTKLEKALK